MNEPCKKCGEYHNNCFELAELTEEEIKQLAYQHRWNGDVEFARAILRKAQEK